MRIILYTCNSEHNRIDKTNYLRNEFQIEGTLRDKTSIINPEILLEKSNIMQFNYNYLYIPEFNRWYFINNIESIRNNLWKIECHVDVLYTWRADIFSSKCIIERTSNIINSNLYLNDGSFIMDSRKYIKTLPFTNGLDENGEYILICAGGIGGESQ